MSDKYCIKNLHTGWYLQELPGEARAFRGWTDLIKHALMFDSADAADKHIEFAFGSMRQYNGAFVQKVA